MTVNLTVKNLTKTYGNTIKALDNVNLEIGNGMFGLLGPNGAGKSSLMRSIATLQSVDSGEIKFRNIDVLKNPNELRKVLGYLPQDFGVYPNESAESLLIYLAQLKGVLSKQDRIVLVQDVLERTNLLEVRERAVSKYSGGMKRRFGIAQILLNDPELIIVDEPTAGLDPEERTRFLNILRSLSRDKTVIFSTHIVSDVAGLCNDIAVLNEGRIMLHQTPQESVSSLQDKVWEVVINEDEKSELMKQFKVLSESYTPDHLVTLRILSIQKPLPDAKKAIPNLQDVFFDVIGRS